MTSARSMSVDNLARRCAEETEKYNRRRANDAQFCFELLRRALEQAGRQDLIGAECDCLIAAQPPREALEARRRKANRAIEGDHYHAIANPAKREMRDDLGSESARVGYRPGRRSATRRRKGKH